MKTDQSVVSQAASFEETPSFLRTTREYANIRIYRDWHFGRTASYRNPDAADLRSDHLEEDLPNLGLFINRILSIPKLKAQFLDALRELYVGLTDIHLNVLGGTFQVFLVEGEFSIPATRLSDGTLRYISLLCILHDPTPPPLTCIEELELGMHPDLLPTIAELMIQASQKTQLIVTTHSDVIVNALSDQPESVYVCEKHEGKTTIQRLEQAEVSLSLEKYKLG